MTSLIVAGVLGGWISLFLLWLVVWRFGWLSKFSMTRC